MWGLVMLFTGGVQDMMDFIGLFSTIMSVVVMAALIYFRVTEPQTPRPYRVRGHACRAGEHRGTQHFKEGLFLKCIFCFVIDKKKRLDKGLREALRLSL